MAVISSEFCVPNFVHLKIRRKPVVITQGKFAVTDEKGYTVFKVARKLLSLQNRHVLTDAGCNPIVTLFKENLSGHTRWLVITDSADLVFSAKLVQHKTNTELHVFVLRNNEEETLPDFRVVGSWLEMSGIIYDKSSTPIARMHKKLTLGCSCSGVEEDSFYVTVFPRVDHAFVVALMVILYEI